MNIALITESISTHSGSRAPLELASHLSQKTKLHIFAYDVSVNKKVVASLKRKKIKVSLFPGNSYLQKIISIPKLSSAINKGHFDLISFHGTLPSFVAATLTRIPIVKTYYGTQFDGYLEHLLPDQKPNPIDQIKNVFGNFFIFLSDKFQFLLSQQQIAISKYTAQEAKKLYGKNIPLIYLGSNTLSQKSSNKPTTRSHNIQYSKFNIHILSVSRLTPYKNFHNIIESVKKVEAQTKKPINLTICGSSPNPKYLSYLNKIKSERTTILTNISDHQLAKLYRNCDLYVTADKYLFFGMPILEAALFEKPTLAYDFCAASEIIDHNKTGYVAKNQKQFEDYLTKLTSSKTLRQKLGRQAKIKATQKFSWQTTSIQYIKLFKKNLKIHD